jgi:hypothetical protein
MNYGAGMDIGDGVKTGINNTVLPLITIAQVGSGEILSIGHGLLLGAPILNPRAYWLFKYYLKFLMMIRIFLARSLPLLCQFLEK